MASYVGGNTASGSGSQNLALPSGAAAGGVVIVAGMESSVGTYTLGSGLSSLYEDTVGTGRAILAGKVLKPTDISAGYVTVTPSVFAVFCWGVWSGVTAIETVGTPTKRASSSRYSYSKFVSPLSSGQTAVVVRFEKSSAKSAGPSVSPATTKREEYWSSNSNSPSIWLGDYTGSGATPGSEATRTFIDTVSSGDGCGVQVSLTDAAASGPSVSVWGGSSEISGCTLSVWDGSSEVPLDLSGVV